jgi:hypothetical protein
MGLKRQQCTANASKWHANPPLQEREAEKLAMLASLRHSRLAIQQAVQEFAT